MYSGTHARTCTHIQIQAHTHTYRGTYSTQMKKKVKNEYNWLLLMDCGQYSKIWK